MDGLQSGDAKTDVKNDQHHSAVADAWGWTESNVVAPFVNSVAIEPINAGINIANLAASPFHAKIDYLPTLAQNQNRNGVESVVQTVSGALGTALVFAGASKATGFALGKAASPLAEDSAFARFARNPLTAQIAGPTLYEGLKNPNDGESRIGNMITVGTAFGAFGLGNGLTRNLSGFSLFGARAGIGASGMVSGRLLGDLYDHRTPTSNELLTSALTGGILNVAVPAMLERNVKMSDTKPNLPQPDVRAEVRPTPTDTAVELPTRAAATDAIRPEPRPPMIAQGKDGSILVLESSGRAASFKDGQWQPGVLFDGKEIVKFTQVLGEQDINSIMDQAGEALRKSIEQ